jgi:hypothetical protein
MARLDLAVGLPDFGQNPFLVGDVRFYGVRDQEVGAPARFPGQSAKAFFRFWLETDAEGGTACVRHAHILTREWKEGDAVTYGGGNPPGTV